MVLPVLNRYSSGHALRLLRRRPPRVRDHPPGHPGAVDQLPGHGRVLRHRLEHRRRLLLAPGRAAAPAHPVPVQQRAGRLRRALPVPARRRQRRVLVAVLAADAAPRSTSTSAGTACPTRRSPPRGRASRARDAVLRAARREPRGVAGCRHQRPARPRRSCRSSRRSSSPSGTRRTTRRTSSATTPPARSRSSTGSSTTRPSTASAAITSPTSPARAARRLRHAAGGVPRRRTGDSTSPPAVERGELGNSIAHGWSPHGAHHVRLTLAAGRDQGGHLPPRLLGEPARREVRVARRRQQGAASSRSSSTGCDPQTVRRGLRGPRRVLGRTCSASCA